MKKLTFLFAIVIAVLTFTSCEPEIVNPETPKTEAFNIYEYVMVDTARLEIGMDTVVNDTTYRYSDYANYSTELSGENVVYVFTEIVSNINVGNISVTIRDTEVSVIYRDINEDAYLHVTYSKETGEEIRRW